MNASRRTASRTVNAYDVMPPEPTMRRHAASMKRPVLVEDAVFEVIAADRAPRQFNDNPAPRRRDRSADLPRLVAVAGVFVVNRAERWLSHLSPQAFMTLIASLFFIAFWLFGGFDALATEPVTRPAPPFAVERVFVEELDANGMKLLSVVGSLVNTTSRTLDVPALSVASQSGDVIGTIRPVTVKLEPGRSLQFAGRFKLAGGKSGAISIFPAM